MIAKSFLGRMENDLCYYGGTDEQIIAVMDKNLHAAKLLEERRAGNDALHHAFDRYSEDARKNMLEFILNYHLHATGGRRAELLKNDAYAAVLEKYK